MTTSISGGPLGLVAVHSWNGFDTNDLGVVPRVRWRKIRGLLSMPDGDEHMQRGGARIGNFPIPGLLRDKTVVYEGYLEADTLHDLMVLRTSVIGAFADRAAEGQMVITPHPDYGDTEFFYRAKCLACDIDEEPPQNLSRLPTREAREVLLSVHMYDPRFYHNVLQDTGAVAAPAVVTNQGTAATDPTVEIHVGAVAADVDLAIVNSTLGKKLQLRTLAGLVPGTISFDFRTRRIRYHADGDPPETLVDLTRFINQAESTWWDFGVPGLAPGANTLTWTGAEITSIRVYWRHATY